MLSESLSFSRLYGTQLFVSCSSQFVNQFFCTETLASAADLIHLRNRCNDLGQVRFATKMETSLLGTCTFLFVEKRPILNIENVNCFHFVTIKPSRIFV